MEQTKGEDKPPSILESVGSSNSLDPEYSLLSYRMLEALRKGDEQQIKTLWGSWPKDSSVSDSNIRVSPSPLHLSVTCASFDVNLFVTKLKGLDVNAQDASGNTPLHLASKSGRLEILKLLLKSPQINPSILNLQGKTPEKVASSSEVLTVFQTQKQEFIAEKSLFLDHHLVQPTKSNVQAIVSFFSEIPRSNLLDINHRHPLSGFTCLHQAVILGDEELVAQLLRLGANVFARDKKGHAPIDLAKTEKIKALLREETPSSVVAVDPNQLPRLEGQLKKWTNYAGGYKLRWFVLESGFLSYYRSQEDTINACRGSLNLANAKLWIDSNDPQKFEVTGKDLTRFHLWAAMLDEAKMWIVAITQTKQYLQNRSDFSHPEIAPSSVTFPVSGLMHNSFELVNSPNSSNLKKPEPSNRSRSNSTESVDLEPPQDEELTMTLNSALTQFDLLERLVVMLGTKINSDENNESHNESQLALINTITQCLSSARVLHTDASKIQKKREDYWRYLYRKEADQNRMWTESLQNLAAEHHAMGEWVQEQQIVPQMVVTQPEPEASAPSFVDDEEDEFFDLDEEESVAEDVENDEPLVEEEVDVGNTKISRIPIRKSFIGYPADGFFRDSLPKIKPGSKPPAVSLWSVLKNAVGKDLTKISLPVHFNEPSSMLQRMGEDMEYSRLLDLAAKQTGSGPERLLWVAAFAMSNYSSTAGRIAKPFNPLLGETFEYVRPDRGFRYISEQVSHHPPVSACYCESPNYIFFAEVDVKSNFWGKSYELLPQGVSHVFLFSENGSKVEHYSWKKVTTAVTNLIVGNPTIEHYGDMIVTNHMTNDVCRLTFKPNRWLSSERNALEGVVTTASGSPVWELSGFWDQYLIAKRVAKSSSGSPLKEFSTLEENDDTPGSGLAKFLSSPSSSDAIRLWKRSPLPSEPLPFKLTPFALTLNHCPPELEPVLPPTDCRRRPDQRGMEDGLYDEASQEKNRLEEKQRETRKAREAKLQAALANAPESEHPRIEAELGYRPQWFEKQIESDTGESYWHFNHRYWKERAKASTSQKESAWEDVPRIF